MDPNKHFSEDDFEPEDDDGLPEEDYPFEEEY